MANLPLKIAASNGHDCAIRRDTRSGQQRWRTVMELNQEKLNACVGQMVGELSVGSGGVMA
ncbi:MAG: hypothetical protein AB7T86_16065, partial [Xanthobacteraceae bacterium]